MKTRRKNTLLQNKILRFFSFKPVLDFIDNYDPYENGIRWRSLMVGLIFGGFGINFISGESPNWFLGIPLQAFAFFLIWNAFNPRSKILNLTSGKSVSVNKNDHYWFWILLSGMFVWAFSCICFYKEMWATGIFSVVFLLGIFISAAVQFPNPPQARSPLTERTALIILLGFTILLRFPFLNQNFTGFQPDEGYYLLSAIDVIHGKPKTPFQSDFFWCYFPRYFMALPLVVFGYKLSVAKGFSAILSTVYVFYFYRWCRVYFGILASLLGAAFFSFCWWNLFFSLSTFEHLFTVLFQVIAFYFLAKALKEGNRFYFGVTGICLAASFMSYTSGPLVPFIAAITVACYFSVWKEKFFKAYWKHSVFSGLIFLWLLGPFIAFLIETRGHDLFKRANQLSIWEAVINQQQWSLPFERILGTVYTLFEPNYSGIDLRFGISGVPYLDPFIGWFCILGIVLGVFSITQWKNLICFFGIVLGLMATAFASESNNPQPMEFAGGRCFFILPFLCFFIAQGFDWAVRLISLLPKPAKLVAFSLLFVLFCGSVGMNVSAYYFKFDNVNNYDKLGFRQMLMADVLKSFYPKDHIVVEAVTHYGIFYSNCWDTEQRFLTYGQVQVNEGAPFELPISAEVTKDVVIFFTNDKYEIDEMGKVRSLYPDAIWKEYKDKYDRNYLNTVEISKNDIQAMQKGMKLNAPLI